MPNIHNKKKNYIAENADKEPVQLENIFQHRNFYQIVHKAAQIDAINNYIKECIEPECSAYYHVLNLKGNTLVIGTPSQSFATRLRLSQMQWLSQLRQSNWPQISGIEIKIISS